MLRIKKVFAKRRQCQELKKIESVTSIDENIMNHEKRYSMKKNWFHFLWNSKNINMQDFKYLRQILTISLKCINIVFFRYCFLLCGAYFFKARTSGDTRSTRLLLLATLLAARCYVVLPLHYSNVVSLVPNFVPRLFFCGSYCHFCELRLY